MKPIGNNITTYQMFWLTFMVKSMQVFPQRTDNNLDFLEEIPKKEGLKGQWKLFISICLQYL